MNYANTSTERAPLSIAASQPRLQYDSQESTARLSEVRRTSAFRSNGRHVFVRCTCSKQNSPTQDGSCQPSPSCNSSHRTFHLPSDNSEEASPGAIDHWMADGKSEQEDGRSTTFRQSALPCNCRPRSYWVSRTTALHQHGLTDPYHDRELRESKIAERRVRQVTKKKTTPGSPGTAIESIER